MSEKDFLKSSLTSALFSYKNGKITESTYKILYGYNLRAAYKKNIIEEKLYNELIDVMERAGKEIGSEKEFKEKVKNMRNSLTA